MRHRQLPSAFRRQFLNAERKIERICVERIAQPELAPIFRVNVVIVMCGYMVAQRVQRGRAIRFHTHSPSPGILTRKAHRTEQPDRRDAETNAYQVFYTRYDFNRIAITRNGYISYSRCSNMLCNYLPSSGSSTSAQHTILYIVYYSCSIHFASGMLRLCCYLT